MKAASELFYNNGIAATGIDTITARAGVAKMSLYNNFASKAELVQAYVRSRHDEWHRLCLERIGGASTPQERILAVFDSYLDHAAFEYQRDFRGCGLYNAAAELPVGDPGRAEVAAQKDEAERLIREALEELLPQESARAADMAQHLSFLLEGAMTRAGLEGHDARLRAARRIAASLLDQL
ncbi:TetR/AcrR family transcriptional regulator [Rubellimicrobium roseum]|uniref:Helix-turn-helix transcriptional regulator n=1 Tax=Rubellimicrobium roseum TaxID=687525 RepID=A0A5C4NFQ0_9RHOB|nr:TetR/AcrR family transcriptional regulator [Rubellimicrobium roseum]TNC72198.1 helix-turn-helix transcriptional regulator [Rubellimicrobium roseum]